MPAKKAPPPLYQLKITLTGIRPPIWRRIQVPGSIRLCCFHDVLQAVLGWTDSHLHQFEKDDKYWGDPEFDEFGDLELIDESKVQLVNVLGAEGESLTYLYDFGDNWRHTVVLEKVIPTAGSVKFPFCLGGARRCPPEDVGGVPGYEEFLEVIFDPAHEEHDHMVTWAGGSFHAEEFDLNGVNEILSRMRLPIRHRR